MSDSRRPLILGAAAAGLIGLLAVDTFLGGGDASSPADGTPPVSTGPTPVPPPDGAPPGAGLDELQTRYRSVTLKRPFTTRSFKPKPKPREPRGPAPEPTPTPPPPSSFSLRLTGMLAQEGARIAVLEEGGTGRGILLEAGKRLGDMSIAAVETSSVVLQDQGNERRVALGEMLTLPLALKGELDSLRPAASIRRAARTASGKSIEISEEKRLSILERLRARRRSSVKDGQGGDK